VSDRPAKLLIIGLEGLCPELLTWAIESGACPRLAELRSRGSLAPVWVTAPGDVATCWASFASGAPPSTHGVVGMVPYAPGDALPEGLAHVPEAQGVRSLGQRGRAEWLWQAAERAGKRVVMVSFPGGWPAPGGSVVAIDGAGPLASATVRPVGAHLFATRTAPAEGATHVLRTTQPSGWANPPDSVRAPLEVALIVTGAAELQPTGYGWMAAPRDGETPKVDPTLMYCGLIVASGDGARGDEEPPFDTLVLCRGRDAESPVARLRVGEWSGWIGETLTDGGEPRAVRFRFQLRALSPGGREVALYRTAMFRTDGWAHPQEVADRLIDAAVEADAQALDAADGVAWLCEELARDGRWDLLLTHLPLPDGVLHEMLNALHVASPQYRAEAQEEAWERVRRAMAAADCFVGQVIDACADEDTAIAIVSPHGMVPTEKYVWLGKALIDAGLATYVNDDDTGGIRLHLPDSRALLGDHPLAQSVWVNLEGRSADGVVPPEQYERVRTEIINALLSVRDPFTNACPVALALRREEAGFLGLDGDGVGDVVYLMAPGYATDPRFCSLDSVDPSLVSADAVCGSAGPLQGAHHGYLPGAALGGFSTDGVLVLAGPGVREAGGRSASIRLPDVAPTLCQVLGIDPPADAEGLVATDLLGP